MGYYIYTYFPIGAHWTPFDTMAPFNDFLEPGSPSRKANKSPTINPIRQARAKSIARHFRNVFRDILKLNLQRKKAKYKIQIYINNVKKWV